MINMIILGDCLEKMKEINDKSIDLILTDLPYGVTARNDWDVIIPIEKLWDEWNRIKKETTPVVLTSIQPFTSKLVMSNINNFKYEWIWQKSKGAGFLNAKKQPLRRHESILVFYIKQSIYNPQFIKGKPYTRNNNNMSTSTNYGNYTKIKSHHSDGNYYPYSIIHIPNAARGTVHPTQKPVKLFEYLIKTYTNEGMTVLDCCAGSGTTAIACLNTNRRYICIEKEEKYYKIMENRIKEYNAQTRLI